ncbi:MAG: hypothetical protein AB7S75_17465 [Desulfococcaceae bacterium]
MNNEKYLDELVKDCLVDAAQESANEKAIGWEPLIAIFVYEVIRPMLPEIREWLKLAVIPIDLKRQEIRKKLMAYAEKKELDFTQAEKAAGAVVKHITQEKIKKLA